MCFEHIPAISLLLRRYIPYNLNVHCINLSLVYSSSECDTIQDNEIFLLPQRAALKSLRDTDEEWFQSTQRYWYKVTYWILTLKWNLNEQMEKTEMHVWDLLWVKLSQEMLVFFVLVFILPVLTLFPPRNWHQSLCETPSLPLPTPYSATNPTLILLSLHTPSFHPPNTHIQQCIFNIFHQIPRIHIPKLSNYPVSLYCSGDRHP